MNSQDELARYKATLKRNLTRLHDSILNKFLQETNKPHGSVIDDEFSAWWNLFGDTSPFFEDNGSNIHDDDIVIRAKNTSTDNSENDSNLAMLHTFDDFYCQMKRIIKQISHFSLCFKTKDGKVTIEPNSFWIEKNEDGDEVVILSESKRKTVWTIGGFCKLFNQELYLKETEDEDIRPFPRFNGVYVFAPKEDMGDKQSSDDEIQGVYFTVADHFEIIPSEKNCRSYYRITPLGVLCVIV